MKFSIFVVSLNAGEALKNTIDSILKQEGVDFEIIVKDGGSIDGSLNLISNDSHLRLVSKEDKGIYDAMNQAIEYATGDYGLFMNCGDSFYSVDVLKKVEQFILGLEDAQNKIFYGDCYTANRGYILKYPKNFNDYICFTKVLCHQATIYSIDQLRKRKFSNCYKIAADFEYYVYAYRNGYKLVHIPEVIAYYEGNGASETLKNRKLALQESKIILKENFSKKEYKRIWWKMQIRGVGIKRFLVQRKWFYPIYCKLAERHYNKRKRR